MPTYTFFHNRVVVKGENGCLYSRGRLTRKADACTIESMKQKQEHKSTKHRRRSLKGSPLGPWVLLCVCVLLLGSGLWIFIRFAPGWIEQAVNAEPDLSCLGLEATPTPAPTSVPTPAPTPEPGADQPLYGADLGKLQKEIVVGEYQYGADFSYWQGQLLFAAGNYHQDGDASFVRCILTDLETGEKTYLSPAQSYKSIRYPCANEKWLVYLDVQGQGGGNLRVWNRQTGESRILKTVHMGVPYLTLWEDTVFWTERTGSSRFKLFACDLTTGESVTLAVLENSAAAVSRPFAYEGMLLYVGEDGVLRKLTLTTGKTEKLDTGVFVHDPKTNGREIAFLTGNHGYDSDLCYLDAEGNLHTAAKGVADFAIGDFFLAYGDMDKVYVYFFSDGSTFCITRSGEKAQFLGAGGKYVWWMDVTWRDKDILEYMEIPHK